MFFLSVTRGTVTNVLRDTERLGCAIKVTFLVVYTLLHYIVSAISSMEMRYIVFTFCERFLVDFCLSFVVFC